MFQQGDSPVTNAVVSLHKELAANHKSFSNLPKDTMLMKRAEKESIWYLRLMNDGRDASAIALR